MKTILHVLLSFLSTSCLALEVYTHPMREWTAKSGKTVHARLISNDDRSVTLSTEQGKKLEIAQSGLSEKDIAYVDGLSYYILKAVAPDINAETSGGYQRESFICGVQLQCITKQPRMKPPAILLTALVEDKEGGGVKTVCGGLSDDTVDEYESWSSSVELQRSIDLRGYRKYFRLSFPSRRTDSNVKRVRVARARHVLHGILIHIWYDGKLVCRYTDLTPQKRTSLGLPEDWWQVTRESPILEYRSPPRPFVPRR